MSGHPAHPTNKTEDEKVAESDKNEKKDDDTDNDGDADVDEDDPDGDKQVKVWTTSWICVLVGIQSVCETRQPLLC